ncbi:MAG: PAS domain S-box protein [Methanolobus sp.]|nr:PAS domain S-box protein [Methanolobus sp.]
MYDINLKNEEKTRIIHLFIAVLAAIFTVEFSIMLIIYFTQPSIPFLTVSILDSLVLVLIVFPVIYLLNYRPLLLQINERKQALEKLRESETRYRTLFNQSPDGVVITDPQTATAIEFNEAAHRQLGYTREEFKQLRIFDYEAKETFEETKAHIEKVLHEGRDDFETLHHTKGGEIRNVLVTVQIFELSGQTVFQSIFRDITDRKRFEDALRQSEEKYRTLIENTQDGVFIVQDAKVQFANKAACRMAGYTLDEAIEKDFREFVAPEDLEMVIGHFNRMMAGEDVPREYELRALRKDGAKIIVNMNVELINYSGRVVIMGVAKDITERKRLEEALHVSEERYRNLYHEAPIAYMSAGSDGRIRMVNKRSVELLGYSEDDLLGREVFDLYADTPSGKEKARALFMQFLAGEEIREEELEMRRADGRLIWIRLTVGPILDTEGHVVESRSMVVDITEHKRIDDALHASEERYRLLFERAGDAIFIVEAEGDNKGEIIAANQAAADMHGYAVDELITMKITDLDAPVASEKVIYGIKHILRGELIKTEIIHRKKDSTVFPVEVSAGLLELEDHKHILAFYRDITERKQMEEKLKQTMTDFARSNAELEQFAYVASHDLQEPLVTVISFTQLIANRYKGKLDKDADEFINYIVDGGIRMQRMINDLLAYSRVGTHGKPFELTGFETIFDQSMANLKIAIEESGAVVTHDPLPALVVDASQIVQLFQNLLSNAIKFRSTEVPRVHVSAEDKGNEWIFSVRDNGIGMAPEFFEQIFVIFQRLHSEDAYPGTGIGLAICKKIVERHGGRIWVESAPGNGSIFYFTIPK